MAHAKPAHPPLPEPAGVGETASRQRLTWAVDAAMSVLPEADPEVVRECLIEVVPSGRFGPLARQVVGEPSLLVSGSAHSTGQVRQLIAALLTAQVPGVAAPRCEACGHAKVLMARTATGGMLCEACWRATRRERCSGCGHVRYPGGRAPDGSALCGECMRRRRVEACGGCGKVGPPQGRRADGRALCQTCARQRRARACAGCGQIRVPRYSGAANEPLCRSCWRARQFEPCADCARRWEPGGRLDDGSVVCKSCWLRRQNPHCARCDVRTPKPREHDGQLLCRTCFLALPAPECIQCGRRTRSGIDRPEGLVCPRCWEWVQLAGVGVPRPQKKRPRPPRRTCDRCSKVRQIATRRTGEDVCRSCANHPQVLCAQCGHPRVTRRGVRTPACPRCMSTTTLTCPTCGGGAFSLSTSEGVDRCLGCRLRPWIIAALAGDDGKVSSQLMPFVTRLSAAEDHDQVRRWLHRGAAMTVLREMAQGRAPIEHSTLDEAAGEHRARATSVEHLRRLLVAAEVLPKRDEHLTRLERDIRTRLTALDPEDATVLRRFVTWYTLPRTRLRIAQGRDPEGTCRLARNSLTGPSRFLTHLRNRGITLSAMGQGDLEAWAAENPGYVIATVIFLRWARRQRLVPVLELPKQQMNTPRQFSDAEDQWTIAKRCLTDNSLPHRLRLVGALVLLYGQQASTIARLRRTDVTNTSGLISIRLGHDAVVLDEPLATIAAELAAAAVPDAQPRGIARAFNAEGDGWLFPGRGPGKPLGEAALRKDLTKLGIRTRSGRNTALLALARDVPPMVLCDLLGVGSSTAERWRGYAGGAWATYASTGPH